MALVAVTGVAGFIGTRLHDRLSEDGVEVRALDRNLAPDLGDENADWSTALTGADVVVNLAGRAHDISKGTESDASQYKAVNAQGAERVAMGAEQAGAHRFIQVSTIKVLGEEPVDGVRFRESDPLHPSGVYAESKAQGESLVQAALRGTATECVIVRLPLAIGTPFKGNLALLERAIRRGVPLPLSHRSIGKRTYVQMEDLMNLLVRLIMDPGTLPPVVHARSTPDLRAADVARLVGEEIGREPRLFPVPAQALRKAARLVGRPEYASKLCDEMLVSDELTRAALGPN